MLYVVTYSGWFENGYSLFGVFTSRELAVEAILEWYYSKKNDHLIVLEKFSEGFQVYNENEDKWHRMEIQECYPNTPLD